MFEHCVGLFVSDNALYQQYRDGISALLKEYGGFFRYDFKVSDTLMNESGTPINRVFVLAFPSEDRSNDFFSHDDYEKVRAKFFDASVKHVTLIS
ncbi:DUF1330 domain-containing protein [Marinomonas algicola]|uniref:DUF1330 domain-containing protein n=1 Tax=Marinomonas algicola TaxID=2773454 RepID=UPI0019D52414|nr:DUF1330 domain-containing protein [Marinomonas algicola]